MVQDAGIPIVNQLIPIVNVDFEVRKKVRHVVVY